MEELLHERGIDNCHEAVRFWWHRVGLLFATENRRLRVEGMESRRSRWHLDEVFVQINGDLHYLWRAVDHEGEMLESFLTKTRDKEAALKSIKKSFKRNDHADEIVTDRMPSFGAALRDLCIGHRQETGRRKNNCAESSHQPFRRRERAMLRFRQMRRSQKFAAVHASVHNRFNQEGTLHNRSIFKTNRTLALAKWRGLCAE